MGNKNRLPPNSAPVDSSGVSQKKAAISISGLNTGDAAKQQRQADIPEDQRAEIQGVAGAALDENVPSYIQAVSEKVWNNANNAWIVLGRDRLRSRASCYGGSGDTQAGAIDIVVGRLGAMARSFNKKGKRAWVNPDIRTDAARIYISQKTDIDDNFHLPDGEVGNSKTKSGIALKADGIRIIAREGIKLVTRTDGINSQGGPIDSADGIDLIVSNVKDDLQPIPKGNNVMLAIERLSVHLDALNGVVDALLTHQKQFNDVLTHHTHHGPGPITSPPFAPGFTWETTPSIPTQAEGMKCAWNLTAQVKVDLAICKANVGTYQVDFLTPGGGNYINSRYCNVT